VLAPSDFFGELAQIVRVRFPDVSVWHLPVAAHEFGHFVGPRIAVDVVADGLPTTQHPFQEILKRRHGENPLAPGWQYAHEYFADMFATYALGPAFAYTCLVLRFDPVAASLPDGHHPPAARRVELILRTLEESAKGPDAPYGGVVAGLRQRWREERDNAGQAPDLPGDAADDVAATFEELHPLLDVHLGGARYTTFLRAQELAPKLRAGPLAAGAGVTIRELLNAAWVARIRGDERDQTLADAIEENVLATSEAV
jgi:hypothetical protein